VLRLVAVEKTLYTISSNCPFLSCHPCGGLRACACEEGACATVERVFEWLCACACCAMQGSYADMVSTRAYTVQLVGVLSLSSCTVNGTPVPQGNADGVPGTWHASSLAVSVYLPPISAQASTVVVACGAQ
jgi:hypothetical protein